MENGFKNVPIPYLINSVEKSTTSDKVDRIIYTLEDIINTFKTCGCPEAKQLLREILQRNHLLGGSPLGAASQHTEAYVSNTSDHGGIGAWR